MNCSLSALVGIFLVSALLCGSGCGGDERATVIINLEPWGLDFCTQPEPEPGQFMYMVERAFYMSVLRFKKGTVVYDMVGVILSPTGSEFSPYTVNVATGASADIMFVTDITPGNMRLLALNPIYTGDVGLDSLLLAATSGSGAQNFVDLRGVTSLYMGDGKTYRVFLSDANRVWIIDYDVSTNQFSFFRQITGGCFKDFLAPYGLAVDAREGLFTSPSLYVVDFDLETLYRFTGLQSTLFSPSCSRVMDSWNGGSERFRDPRGVGVFPGQDLSDDALIVVGDAKKTASGNDRVSAFHWTGFGFDSAPLPANFQFFPEAYPFDVAFDANGDLYVSYPEASALAGPAY